MKVSVVNKNQLFWGILLVIIRAINNAFRILQQQ